jgi:diguanylate cyclase (GGDEF)-like protein
LDSTQDQVGLNLQLSKELAIVKKELLFQNKEKSKRAAELVIANAQKVKRAAELVIADAEKAERAAELLIANIEKAERSAELVIADAEKAERAAELLIADMEKAQRAAELIIVNAQALYDELTKLPNRRLFIDRFNQTLLTSRRSKTYSAMLFLDLDKLKEINDGYGHAVGDLLLIEVARRAKASIRDTDTVARFGGDEFATLLNNLDVDINIATLEVEYIALKILNSIAMPISIEHDGQELIIHLQCTVSIGITLFLYETGDEKAFLENVLLRSDRAMYQAKKAGGNQVLFYQGNASE